MTNEITELDHASCIVQENGRLPDYIGVTVRDLLKELAGKWIYISISERKEKCSLDALRYYRGVLVPAARKYRAEQGDPVTPEQCHEELLSTFSEYVQVKGFDGEIRLLPKRTFTSKNVLDKEGFHKYCLAVEAFLLGEGVKFPAHPKYNLQP